MLPTIRLLAAAAVSMDKTSITPFSISLMKRNTGVARPVQDAVERTCSLLMIAVLSFGLSSCCTLVLTGPKLGFDVFECLCFWF